MKRLLVWLLVFLLVIPFAGCQNDKTEEKPSDTVPASYRDELEKVVRQEPGTELVYLGDNGYGHALHIQNINTTSELTIVKAEGVMLDDKGDGTAHRGFSVEYVVDGSSIREIIRNHDIYKSNGDTETVNSIIPNQIILQGPLKEGNLWLQSFHYKGKERSAKTVLVSVSENKDGKKIYQTETVVEDIIDFPENTYKEIRVYEEEKGLISFQTNARAYAESSESEPFQYELQFIRKTEAGESETQNGETE